MDGAGDRAPVKLRASCNACNESKVRCSQTKPTCDRCKKTGMPCVFGLSRRSHKDAPRIMSSHSRSASSSVTGTGAGVHLKGRSRVEILDDFNLFSQHPALAPNSVMIPRSADGLAGIDVAALWAFDSSDPMDFLSSSSGALDPSLNSASLPGGNWGSADDAVSPLPPSPQPLMPPNSSQAQSRPNQHPQQQLLQRLQHEQSSLPPHDHHGPQHAQDPGSGPEDSACACISRVIPEVARKSQAARAQAAGRPLSFDVELLQLKQAILACEASMVCQSHPSDPTVIMITGLLIGDIVDGFKTLLGGSTPATNTSPSSCSTSWSVSAADSGPTTTSDSQANNVGSPTAPARGSTWNDQKVVSPGTRVRPGPGNIAGEPRLSWGVLQLEDDDEVELRHRLCQLYFRRLRSLLRNFEQAVRQFREAQGLAGSSTATFIMACDYLRMWLEQKVDTVKELFNDADRDEL
ncbi:hypothetical protein KVR01_011804 [Diaporthe batatas]|uniref:uncharacterized protein n=1 Tax=Diaporthe batatas TaxID=748121 RepID=UPI001D050408|nr:uncharacterized protein KVR01_011804 [Diaporthe batatas]KAG8158682.1 hypothetical protein KVR01_011804 [Diaporthe batatas]